MVRPSATRLVFLTVNALLFILCLLHVPALLDRPAIPFRAAGSGVHTLVYSLTVPERCGDLVPGDTVLAFDGNAVPVPRVLEFLADFSTIGAIHRVHYGRPGASSVTTVSLTSFYGPGSLLGFALVGLITWVLALSVLMRGPPGETTIVLHCALVSLAVVVLVAWEGVAAGGVLPFPLPALLFFGSYVGVALFFFRFTWVFPRRLRAGRPPLGGLIYLPALVVAGGVFWSLWRAVLTRSAGEYLQYNSWFHVFHVVILLVYVLGGIINFLRAYVATVSREERQKLQWILFGLSIGPTPFIFLTSVPTLLDQPVLIPEAVTLPFLIVIPLAFVASFIRHQILDITLVISRTAAYTIVLGAALGGYLLVVAGMAYLVGRFTLEAGVVAAVLVALMFEPLRRRIQGAVDRRFFRIRYSYREAERAFAERIKRCAGIHDLAATLVEETQRIIPVERIGFFKLKTGTQRLRCVAHKGYDLLERRGLNCEPEKLQIRLHRPVALQDRIESGVPHAAANPTVFSRWEMEIVFSMLSVKGEFLGFLVLGRKRSGTQYSAEDVDLLNSVVTLAGLEIERVHLQQEVVQKEIEARHFAELNETKSAVVSYVSHELRNPISSIGMFTEFLQATPACRQRKVREWLRTIEGEAGRVRRMVDTFLDVASIERGSKTYAMKAADLGVITREVLSAMRYQLSRFNVRLTGLTRHARYPVLADPDAAKQAMINLLVNAIKYSPQPRNRRLMISLSKRNGWIRWSLRDCGLGIPAEILPHIFDPFYRDPAVRERIKGVGLGLPLVRHIMESHGGTVRVASIEGKGSTFSLEFPQEGTKG